MISTFHVQNMFFSLRLGKIENEYAVEVGPGPGGITRAILDAKVKEVHVIEKDPRFIPALNLIRESVGSNRLHVNIGDCLHFNVSSKYELPNFILSLIAVLKMFLCHITTCSLNYFTEKFEGKVPKTEWNSPERPPLTLFGNLPFNVATPFIIRLLRNMSDKNDLFTFGRVPSILTFQHEVNQLFVYKMFS